MLFSTKAEYGVRLMVALGRREGERQRSESGPDLDDPVARSDSGHAGDGSHRVRIDHEVLPEGAASLEPVAVEEVPDL